MNASMRIISRICTNCCCFSVNGPSSRSKGGNKVAWIERLCRANHCRILFILVWTSCTCLRYKYTRKKIMSTTKTANARRQRLLQYLDRYNALKAELQTIGFICQGSLQTRRLACGNPNCRCQQDPESRHGPYQVGVFTRICRFCDNETDRARSSSADRENPARPPRGSHQPRLH